MIMKNLKLKDYLYQGERYSALEYIEPNSSYNGKVMNTDTLTYKDVKTSVNLLSNISNWDDMEKLFKTCFKVESGDWFLNGRVKEYYEARNYIIKEFKRLVELEEKLLKSIGNVNKTLWKQAGGDKLNRFGGILSLNQLGKIYGVYPFDLENKPFMEILLLLTIEKEQREIEVKYSELNKAAQR